jgi:REP element-mobilizing transposase RayT
MFKQEENKKLCEEVLYEVAKRHKIEITELSVMSDHIHTVVGIPPTMSVSKALQILKGASSRELFQRKPNLRLRYPRRHLWSPGNFTEPLEILMQKQLYNMYEINVCNKPLWIQHPRTTKRAIKEAPSFMKGSMSQIRQWHIFIKNMISII